MVINSREDYSDDAEKSQGSKKHSLAKADKFVQEIQKQISPLLKECVIYKSFETLGKAPAVRLSNKKLAIAPDLYCVTKKGKVFWIEVKDKAQRFYHPDTGADLFQVYGWYCIFRDTKEPVYVMFQDPSFERCLPKKATEDQLEKFKQRYEKFDGEPYGSWLSELLISEGKYPRIFSERSRDNFMYIFYFLTTKMKSTDWNSVINDVENDKVKQVEAELKAFFHDTNELIGEAEIRKKVEELYRSINSG